ncbi:MAG: hypothetical protein PHI88_00485 [Candidatus Pacebacteria bacterium]|jgi:hypothetical protein|nr:hypothetical protein [Candidatus Paceibacterota bacterium]
MKIPKEEIEKLFKIKGEINGIALLEDKRFFLDRFGKDDLKRIEDEISNIIGEEFRYDKIASFKYYPLYLSVLATLILKYEFNFNDDGLRDFGKEGAKVSLIIKLFLRHVISLKSIQEKGPAIWRKYFSNTGKLTIEKFDDKKKTIILKIEDFNPHPLYCRQIEGVIYQLFSYIVKDNKNLKVEETECTFRGSKNHKFKISW